MYVYQKGAKFTMQPSGSYKFSPAAIESAESAHLHAPETSQGDRGSACVVPEGSDAEEAALQRGNDETSHVTGNL